MSSARALPVELLAEIVRNLDGDNASLAALARVNTTFCHLAYPFLWKFRVTDCRLEIPTTESTDLFIQQTREAARNGSRLPARGPFIRHLVVKNASHVPDDAESMYDSEDPCRSHRNHVWDCLRNGILEGMPRLDTLEWKQDEDFTDCFWEMIADSGVRHLKLDDVGFYQQVEDYWMDFINADSLGLETLSLRGRTSQGYNDHLEANAYYDEDEVDESLSYLVRSLCYGSTRTLRSLHVDMPLQHLRDTELPVLEEFSVGHRDTDVDRIVLKQLASSPLKRLDLTLAQTLDITHLPQKNSWQLEHLALPAMTADDESMLPAFLKQHSQLKNLTMRTGHYGLSEEDVLPLLSSGLFSSLTSLWLVKGHMGVLGMAHRYGRGCMEFAESSFVSIGKIQSLRQLHLGTICSGTSRKPGCWPIDHDQLRASWKSLVHLEKLSFIGDNYDNLTIHSRPGSRALTSSSRRLFATGHTTRISHAKCSWEDDRTAADLWPYEDDIRGYTQAIMDLWARPDLDEHLLEQDETGKERDSWIPTFEPGLGKAPKAGIQVPAGRYADLGIRDLNAVVYRNRILAQAEKYAAVFPRLTWMLCGGFPIRITKPGCNSKGNAMPLSSEPLGHNDRAFILRTVFGTILPDGHERWSHDPDDRMKFC